MDFAANYLKCGKNATEILWQVLWEVVLQQMYKIVNLTIADLISIAGHIIIV